MNAGFISHIPEDLLEEYALGKVPDPNCTPVDEHLLICPACQNSLEEIDEYVRVMRGALVALPHLPSKRSPLPKLSSSFDLLCRCV